MGFIWHTHTYIYYTNFHPLTIPVGRFYKVFGAKEGQQKRHLSSTYCVTHIVVLLIEEVEGIFSVLEGFSVNI